MHLCHVRLSCVIKGFTYLTYHYQGHVNYCVTFAVEYLAKGKTVRDRGLVPKDHQSEMAYGESNGHVINDFAWCLPDSPKPDSPKPISPNLEKVHSVSKCSFLWKKSYSVSSITFFPNFLLLLFWAFAIFLVCSITFYLFYGIPALNANRVSANRDWTLAWPWKV